MSKAEIQAFILSKGYDFTAEELDGRFHQDTDSSNRKVWYISRAITSELNSFCFGDYRTGEVFKMPIKAKLSKEERGKLSQFTKEQITKQTTKHLEAKERWSEQWRKWRAVEDKTLVSKYLERKKLPRTPDVLVRRAEESASTILVIPIYCENGEVWTLQQIHTSGDKPFQPGGRSKGLFHPLGDESKGPYLIGEGYATCLSAFLATGLTTYCAFSASNLEPVLRTLMLKKNIRNTDITLLCDWDGATYLKTGKNPGMLKAQELSKKFLLKVALPNIAGRENENIDFSDNHVDGNIIIRSFPVGHLEGNTYEKNSGGSK